MPDALVGRQLNDGSWARRLRLRQLDSELGVWSPWAGSAEFEGVWGWIQKSRGNNVADLAVNSTEGRRCLGSVNVWEGHLSCKRQVTKTKEIGLFGPIRSESGHN